MRVAFLLALCVGCASPEHASPAASDAGPPVTITVTVRLTGAEGQDGPAAGARILLEDRTGAVVQFVTDGSGKAEHAVDATKAPFDVTIAHPAARSIVTLLGLDGGNEKRWFSADVLLTGDARERQFAVSGTVSGADVAHTTVVDGYDMEGTAPDPRGAFKHGRERQRVEPVSRVCARVLGDRAPRGRDGAANLSVG